MPQPKIEILAHKAVYPERSCREAVWGDHLGYNCELPELHSGPCVSWTVRASLQRRQAWEISEQAQEAP